VPASLSFDLHVLTARLDRAADRILRAEVGVSYSRFLTLFMVTAVDATSQRALAECLGVTEPSVSRMTRVLSGAGLLRVEADSRGGNRRALALTPEGQDLVERCCELLDAEFGALMRRSGVPPEAYARNTTRLLAALGNNGIELVRP